jgi:ribosomal protein S18 acetylase RimI-like enzyme
MSMQNLTLQNYRSRDLAKLAEFFKTYLKKYPDAKLSRPEFYTYHPALEEGENVFCVLDSGQQIIGFAPLFPVVTTDGNAVTGPHDIWTIILASPDLETAEEVRELLFHSVVERVNRLKAVYALSRVRLAADLMVSQKADIEYLLQKGFKPFEQVYVMSRDTCQTSPTISVPIEITFRQSNLVSEEEQTAYLEVFNACFPENPKTVDELQVLLHSPLWDKGRVITAYSSSNELVGSILVYWDEQKGYGVTDDVMVLPNWRGQNIAKNLIGEGLRYFRAQGIPEVWLEVKVSNVPAVSVYTSMGYSVINQESMLGKFI